jgi:Cu(I)-responsive transcriptional regulator
MLDRSGAQVKHVLVLPTVGRCKLVRERQPECTVQATPPSMNIGDAARASGVTAKMIRHYESIGLVPAPRRTGAGYRLYSEREVRVLQFIHRGRALGFSLDQIKNLLALWEDKGRASADVRALAQTHIEELDRKIAEMAAMRRTLVSLAASCHGDARSACPILDDLATH